MTSINQKVFSRAFHSHWDRENCWRIGGDMAKWSLWHLTEPFWSRDSQRVHREDEDGNQRSKVRNPQGTGWHEKILWPTKNSGSSVQTQRQSLPWRIGHLDYTPLTETLASIAWPFCSRTADQTYGLSLKAATLDEATPSSVQRSKAHSSSRQPDYRMQNRGPPTAHSHRWRSGVGSRGNTQQSLALEKIVTNFIWPYLHQFSIDSHGLNGYGKPLKRPFNRY